MKLFFLLFILFSSLLFLTQSCSISLNENTLKSAKEDFYYIEFEQGDWILKKDNRSDYVFENQLNGQILLSNSFCGDFQEQELEHLATKTFKTVKDFKIIHGTYTHFKGREAYKLNGAGYVDGVQVSLQLLNTRRNNCYFDFVSIKPNKSLSKDTNQLFQSFLDSVIFK